MLVHSSHRTSDVESSTQAKIVVIIYEDYECEYCAKVFRELKSLREYYEDEIVLEYKNFPATSIHPNALLTAQIVEACAYQNKFIESHDLMFEYQDFLDYGVGGIIRVLEKDLSVSIDQLFEDLQDENLKKKVNNDIESAIALGIKNTPAIFIGGVRYEGAIEFDKVVKAIDTVFKRL